MSKDKELSRDWNYEYGIFARINGRSGSIGGWNEEQVKRYMDKNDITYRKTDTMSELVENLKKNEDAKYEDVWKDKYTEDLEKKIVELTMENSELKDRLTELGEDCDDIVVNRGEKISVSKILGEEVDENQLDLFEDK